MSEERPKVLVGPPAQNGWNSHVPLLKAALSAVTGPVIELGAGDGSTPLLHELCNGVRPLVTMETSPEYLRRFERLSDYGQAGDHYHAFVAVSDWSMAPIERWFEGKRWGVALVDHAPGERRIHDIRRLAPICDLIVIHDTEPGQARAGYGYDEIWSLFPHILHDTRLGTWTSVVSQTVDVTRWSFE
jgi:hypothetical protein